MSTNEDTSSPQPEQEKEDKKYRASSAVTLKTLSAWDQAKLSPWYHPRFWLDLLIHPSAEFKMNHVRRRARLFSLVALCFLVCGIIANGIAYKDRHDANMLGVQLLANLLMLIAYALSRTKFATLGKSLGIFTVWLLTYLCTVINLKNNSTSTGDVTVTDSINWLFTPAWYVMAAIFLSRSMTMFILLLDAASLFFMPVIAGSTFYAIRKVLFFHMVNGILLLLASIVAFRDKLQLYSQQDGQVHEDQHRAGTLSRSILQPHKDITDRIFRRRARILSAFHLGLIPFSIIWAALESTGWLEGAYDPVVIALAVCVVFASLGLYVLSRTQYSRWASRLTIALLLALPYIYNRAPTTSFEGTLYANLITISSSAILGVTLLSGPELVALSGIVFFFNLYSPVFPPHIVLSLILLAASLVYRRDIKEIHDTAFHRDDLYEDDSGDLLIPWEKKYFFHQFSYIQMVTCYYLITFGVMVLLGITAAIAAAVTPALPYKALQATLVAPGQPASYVLLIHTRDCPSLAPQTFKIVGTLGRFQFVHNSPLGSNTSTTLSLNTPSSIGDVVELGFSLGNGNYYINQYDQCSVDTLELWDNVREKAFTSDVLDSTDLEGSTQSATSPSTNLRRLLGNSINFRDPICEFGFRGFDCQNQRSNDRAKICAKFFSVQSQSSLSWEKALCIAQEIAQDVCTGNYAAILCYLQGNCTSPIGGCCSGHGTCVVNPNQQKVISKVNSYTDVLLLKKGIVYCQCDPMYSGPNCQNPVGAITCSNTSLTAYSYDGTCNQFFPNGDPLASSVNQTLQRVVPASYSDKLRTMDTSQTNADFVAKNKFPTTIQRNKGAQNMFGIGLWEFALVDMAQAVPNETNVVTYGSKKQYKIKRCKEKLASAPSITAQYANNQTGWIDASPIYGQKPDSVTDSTGSRLDLNKVTASFNGQNRSKEFIAVAGLLARYHNKFASLLEIYFCYSPISNAVDPACATGNKTNTFAVSRFATIRFLQALVEVELLPSFFYDQNNPNTPFTSQTFPKYFTENILQQQPQVINDFTFTPPQDYNDGDTFAVGTRLLPTVLPYHFSVATDTSKVDDITNNPATPYNSNNIGACTATSQAYIASDKTFISTLYNLFSQAANGWGSQVQGPTNGDLLIDAIQRARDLGLGQYGDYIDALDTVSNVNAGVELYLGCHLETLGYPPIVNRTGWNYASEYAQVVLAFTYQLHNAIKEDRLGVIRNDVNIVHDKFLDTGRTYCAFGCPDGGPAQLAYRVLTGINSPSGLYQGLYFDSVTSSNILSKLKSAVTVTLFYDLLGGHYNDFDGGLAGLADDCIPNVLSLLSTEASQNVCGCCVDADLGYSPNVNC